MIMRNESMLGTTFEEWLMERYILDENPLDDMIPDGFNDWLEGKDIEDFLNYGSMYANNEKMKLIDRLGEGFKHG